MSNSFNKTFNKSKKAISASRQSESNIKKAAEGEDGLTFLSVQSIKGNGYFTLRRADGRDILGTPRGIFTRGSMRISVGQIVVVEGVPEDSTKIKKHPYEIVGVIQERRQADEFIRAGKMPKQILTAAMSAGAVNEISEVIDDLFEEAGAEEEAEAEAEAEKPLSKRLAKLSGGGKFDRDVEMDDL
jgi:translation initiation factor IF-1